MAGFRLLRPEELHAFLATERALYVAERVAAGEDPAAAAANAERSEQEAFPHGRPAPGHTVFAIEDAGAVVGHLWVGPAPHDPRQWWVYAIDVDEAHRRRGLGRAAMGHAEEVAREAGATAIGLNVFTGNHAAQRLYRSLGYEVTAEHPLGRNLAKALR
jgi:ribosomal protein S18 acetylase RimI-like enzyme